VLGSRAIDSNLWLCLAPYITYNITIMFKGEINLENNMD